MIKKKYLGIDFGEKNIGLASSDPGGNIVFGKGVLRGGGSLDELFERIYAVCKKEEAEGIVFGIPFGKSGEETRQAMRLKRIGDKLRTFLKNRIKNLDMAYVDESFTSYEAEKLLAGHDYKLLKKKYSDHEIAAMLILRRFLNKPGKKN